MASKGALVVLHQQVFPATPLHRHLVQGLIQRVNDHGHRWVQQAKFRKADFHNLPTVWLAQDNQNKIAHTPPEFTHSGLIDQHIRGYQVHPVVHPDIDTAVAVRHLQYIVQKHAVARLLQSTLACHVAGGSYVLVLAVTSQGPDSTLGLTVVEHKILYQSTHALGPTGIDICVECSDHLAASVFHHAVGSQAALKKLSTAEERVGALEGFEIILTANASEEGKLYGSIGPREIADEVTARGIELTKAEVIMGEGPIRYTGEHTVLVHLHADVEAEIKVSINAE